jgi:hypothetical protein
MKHDMFHGITMCPERQTKNEILPKMTCPVRYRFGAYFLPCRAPGQASMLLDRGHQGGV